MFVLPQAEDSSSTSCSSSLSSDSSRAMGVSNFSNRQGTTEDEEKVNPAPFDLATKEICYHREEEDDSCCYDCCSDELKNKDNHHFDDPMLRHLRNNKNFSKKKNVVELLDSSDDDDNVGQKPPTIHLTTKDGSTLSSLNVTNPYKKLSSCGSNLTDIGKIETPRRIERAMISSIVDIKVPNKSATSKIMDRPPAQTIHFNIRNHPLSCRIRLPVSSIFHNKLLSSFLSPSFWPYSHFNEFQSEMVPIIFDDSPNPCNVCVSAPTGAGKTGCFEMSIIHLYQQVILKQSLSNDTVPAIIERLKSHKILYIAPNKALCEERCTAWTKQFVHLTANEKISSTENPAIRCLALTGDYYQNNDEAVDVFSKIQDAHIIVSTPEKWDSLTRRWKENLNILQLIKLLLLDEVHLLGDLGRGCCLETVICRMKMVQNVEAITVEDDDEVLEQTYCKSYCMRIVAVSATLPNCDDIAYFLECPFAHVFDGSYRPVPLSVHVIGCGAVRNNNQFLFDKSLNAKVPVILQEYSNNKPAIVFCHTKKETEIVATELMKQNYYSSQLSPEDAKTLALVAKEVSIPTLQKCLYFGIAYHHAGMESKDRQLVENAFASGVVKCLFATSTLAMGVNLPAHLVVIKGTTLWRGAGVGYTAIDSGTLLQMMGRAGRPGFDTSGTAVIMTDVNNKAYYDSFGGPNAKPIESQLLGKLVEKINIEISQKVIRNSHQCVRWLKSTFFFARALKDPKKYGMKGASDNDMEGLLLETCRKALADLESSEIIRILEDRSTVLPSVASNVMSHHLVDFESMKRFMSLAHDSGPFHLLEALSQCGELQYPVRRSEKNILNEAHKIVRYKLDVELSKFRIQTPSQKAFILLQVSIGQHYLEDFTLRQEMTQIVDIAQRLLKAIEDFSIQSSRHGAVALESFLLRRSLATSLWGSSDGVLNQLHGIGDKTTKKLAERGISTFLDVIAHSNQSIEQASGRHHPFGQNLRALIAKVFHNTLSLSAFIESDKNGGNRVVCRIERCSLDSVPDLPQVDESHNEENKSKRVVDYTLIAHTDRKGGLLMFHRDIASPGEYVLNCPEKFGRLYIYLVSNLVGLDNRLSLDGTEPIETTLFSSCTSGFASTSKDKKKTSSSNSKGLSKDISSNKEKRAALAKKQQEMVNQVCDLRLSKKPRTVSPAAPTDHKAHCMKQSKAAPESKKHSSVTPSPNPERAYPRLKHDQSVPCNNQKISEVDNAHLGIRSQITPSVTRKDNAKRESYLSWKGDSWQEKKRRQTSLQEGSYGAKSKQNPFSAFKFDPNNIEARLDSLSNKLLSNTNESSIIPFDFSGLKASHCNIRTPAKPGLAHSVGLATRRKVNLNRSSYINDRDLLGMKAAEQNAYSMQSLENSPAPSIAGQDVRRQVLQNKNLNSRYNLFFPASAGPARFNSSGSENYPCPIQLQCHQYSLGGGALPCSAPHSYSGKENACLGQSFHPTGEAFTANMMGDHIHSYIANESMPLMKNPFQLQASSVSPRCQISRGFNDYSVQGHLHDELPLINRANLPSCKILNVGLEDEEHLNPEENFRMPNNSHSIRYYHSNESPHNFLLKNFEGQAVESNFSHGGYDANGHYHSRALLPTLYQQQQQLLQFTGQDNGAGFDHAELDGNGLYPSSQNIKNPPFNHAHLFQNKSFHSSPYASLPSQQQLAGKGSKTCQKQQHDYFAEIDGDDPLYASIETDELLGCNITVKNNLPPSDFANYSSIDDFLEQAFFDM